MTKKDTASRMGKLVEEFRASGQSRKAFARAHGIKEGKLQYWISKFTKSKKSIPDRRDSAQDFVPITFPTTNEPEERNILIRLQSGAEIKTLRMAPCISL